MRPTLISPVSPQRVGLRWHHRTTLDSGFHIAPSQHNAHRRPEHIVRLAPGSAVGFVFQLDRVWAVVFVHVSVPDVVG